MKLGKLFKKISDASLLAMTGSSIATVGTMAAVAGSAVMGLPHGVQTGIAAANFGVAAMALTSAVTAIGFGVTAEAMKDAPKLSRG